MNFTAIPGAVRFGRIFERGPEEPRSLDEAAFAAERKFVLAVAEALTTRNALITLALDGHPPLSISPDILRLVQPSCLRLSVFDALDYRLESLRDYQGSSIWIREGDLKAVIRAVRTDNRSTGGRPEHPAKQWYAQQGFQRQGRTMKALQREMEAAVGCRAPSVSAIRGWERNTDQP